MSNLQEQSYDFFISTVNAASKLPFVKVNRDEFLKKQFKNDPHLDDILRYGPQVVFTADSLLKMADKISSDMTKQTSSLSFMAGLPSNPLTAPVSAGADIVQFFGYALNMSQKIAYLFGEDDLFNGDTNHLPEEVKIKIVSYLGVMFGASGASTLLINFSKTMGENVGKKVAQKALTKTTWYPLVKKIATTIGAKFTKKTVQNVLTKSVPIIGGAISGGMTYLTFKPMGNRLAKTLYQNLNGEFENHDMVYNESYINKIIENDCDLI
ncbi:hypothetical protein [Streptococcus iniae]|uniref:Membrane protein n=1 Tax=Streptococcus iniae TaxID=1346 RepID=A0A3L8GD37_STRIN|nr:hypothetical protein [Streptococcus iniae]AGM99728.1 hypothetical protein K710_1983 [Streptococcus iniae SF1]AHY16634.1 membrane protein [Streptococcus iniae]AHY18499.1 membrane protein [Streptococcus iniae]AJG26767.1 membrane protein [Streptococcus iniae]APD32663.1 hypothetical protein BMF34_09335 [Streptococcus iniae]